MTFAEVAIKSVGWAGQTCFFFRFLIQWLASERMKRSIVTAVFWRLSLVGSVLLVIYIWLGPYNVVFLASEVSTIVISLRNLALMGRPNIGLKPVRLTVLALGAAGISAWAFAQDENVARMLAQEPGPWLALGITAQVIWSSRFLLQWIIAERRGKSELPAIFFIMSLVGSFLTLAYASHIGDAILIAGQIPGPIIYGRNLVLQRWGASSLTVPQGG